MTITQNEALQALRDALQIDEVVTDASACTVTEMAKAWGVSESHIRRMVNKSNGIERVCVFRIDATGRRYRTSAYRVKNDIEHLGES